MEKRLTITAIAIAIAAVAASAENFFTTLLGKSEEETAERIENIWQHFFTPGDLARYEMDGEKSVYYEAGDRSSLWTQAATTCARKACRTA